MPERLRHLAVWALCCGILGCAQPGPAIDRAAERRATVDASRLTLLGDSTGLERIAAAARERDGSSERPAAVADSVEFARASVTADRSERISALEELAAGAVDPILRKHAAYHLEQDDAWLAGNLERDALYSRFAAVANGVTQSAVAALQGNPVGVARPVLAGIDAVISGGDALASDRKRVALYRRWLARDGAVEALGEDRAEIERELAGLVHDTVEREVLIASRLIEERRLEAALAHLEAARALWGDDPQVDVQLRRLERAFEDRAARLQRSLEVAPTPASGVGALLDGDAVDTPSDQPQWLALGRSRARHRGDVTRFIFTGAVPVDDPLQRYRAAERESQRSLVDVLEVVLWLPATVIRSIYATFGSPVDDRVVVDALAAYTYAEPRSDLHEERRAAVLEELEGRYRDRGEMAKAAYVARQLGRDDEDSIAPAGETPESPIANDGERMIPLAALGSLAAELHLDDATIDPPRVWLSDAGLRLDESPIDEARSIALDPEQRRRVESLADEWAWRRRVTTADTYRDLHEGVPVEFRAGVGARGVSLWPSLLPERYRGRDRALFE